MNFKAGQRVLLIPQNVTTIYPCYSVRNTSHAIYLKKKKNQIIETWRRKKIDTAYRFYELWFRINRYILQDKFQLVWVCPKYNSIRRQDLNSVYFVETSVEKYVSLNARFDVVSLYLYLPHFLYRHNLHLNKTIWICYYYELSVEISVKEKSRIYILPLSAKMRRYNFVYQK